MANDKIEFKIVNATSWKLKVLTLVVRFLNWATIPKTARDENEIVVNIKIEIE